MKISLIVIGKTDEEYLKTGIAQYEQRLFHYIAFTIRVIPSLKNTKNYTSSQQKEKEAELILQATEGCDQVFLLDERGKEYRSMEFAGLLQQHMNSGIKHLAFVIGGPFGFAESVYKKATGKLSLSRMTFSHQMIRLLFVEQLYRAFTILKNEPYHNE
ncbi:MAG: 23S rRNA (pseudouridine(1915)-N(3))-methyltransferase RlmH [Bacteroidota bacterium]|nr:23S rRNA (pseudouridine(1915)-N(3))-methyltransferase RlmH [Bacteroidota bacterium]